MRQTQAHLDLRNTSAYHNQRQESRLPGENMPSHVESKLPNLKEFGVEAGRILGWPEGKPPAHLEAMLEAMAAGKEVVLVSSHHAQRRRLSELWASHLRRSGLHPASTKPTSAKPAPRPPAVPPYPRALRLGVPPLPSPSPRAGLRHLSPSIHCPYHSREGLGA